MSDVLPDDVAAIVDRAGAEPDPPLPEMEARAREEGFPIVGPAVGRTLRVLARAVDARRVFEFGSGYGYSAVWLAGALPPEGELVLTDYEEGNLADAEAYLDRSGYEGTVRTEVGDALETFAAAEGAFDAVLVDNEKSRYAETFERVRDAVPAGGVVVADNVLAGPVSPADVRAALEGADRGEHAAGVAAYLETVRDDPAFETTVVPLGEGIAVSYRVRE